MMNSGKSENFQQDHSSEVLPVKSDESMLDHTIQELQAQSQEQQQALQSLRENLQQTQQSLAELQTRYKDLYDASPIGYLTLSEYDSIVEGNVTSAELLGLRQEHLKNRAFTEFIVEEDQDIFHLHRRQLFKTREKQSSEIRLKSLDGALRYVRLESIPAVYAGGEIAQFRVAITDMSEHKLELNALWESEFRYGAMFDDASDMIMIYDVNGRLHEANKMTCACLGYSREDLWQMNIEDIDVQEHSSRLAQHIDELRRQENLRNDTIFLCHDGVRIEVEASRRLINYAGNPAILCIARDMTSRKQMEKALLASEGRYKRITDAVTDYIYTVRLQDGRPVETIHRPSSVAVTGYKPEEFASNPYLWITMVHEQDREAVKQQVEDILAGKEIKPLEHRLVRKDGAVRWVKNTCVPHVDNRGKLLSYDGLIQDITERKLAEEALRASEERFRTVANFTYDWETWVGPDRKYLYVSPSCERITGYPPEAFYHDPDALVKITHPDDSARIRAHFCEEFMNEEVQFLDFRLLTAAGENRWIGHICQPVYSDAGEWLGRRSSNRDITAQKQAKEALQESEARYRAMMQAFDGLIYICSQDYRIEFMNEHLIQRTGYDATGQFCYSSLHGIEEICPWCMNDQVFEGQTVRWEVQSPKDQRWYYVVNTPFYHADGRISKQAMILDITERKQAEEALKKSEAHYRMLFEDSPISLWEEDFSEVKAYIDHLRTKGVTDFSGYFDQHPEAIQTCADLVKIVHINKATLQLYKAKSQEEFYQGLNKFFTQESYQLFKEELLAISEGRTVLQRETVSLTLTGEKIYSDLRWVVVPGYERTLSKVLVSIVNITERKLAEDQLKRTMSDLERSNADLEQFAYAASHDLQQPLLMVDCYGQLLMKRYKGKLGADADELLDGIIDGITRMQTLITDLLEYSRLHRPDSDTQWTDCGEILAKSLHNLRALIEQHQVVITFTTLPTVNVNSSQFVRLFQNLVSNAIKFRREIQPVIHISAQQREKEWLFAVQDNGIGIASHNAQRIFVIFERLHSREQYPGTGIGLAMCKKIVEQHGGRIWVESELEQGATFYFTVPIA